MTQEKILQTLLTTLSKTTGQKGHVILDSSYSGSDIFETIVILQAGTIAYTDNISGQSFSNVVVENKDAFYGSMSNVTLASGTTAIGYYIQ